MGSRMIDNFQQQLEWVFGLTGGELADRAWEYEEFKTAYERTQRDYRDVRVPEKSAFAYWYEGTPDYWSPRDRYESGVEYRTAVVDEMFGAAPAAIRDDQGIWQKVKSFRNNGETECPGRQDDNEPRNPKGRNGEPRLVGEGGCALCEEDPGHEHGYIYIGDGWGEVVYKLHKSRYLESEEPPRRESHQRTALTRRARIPMQEHGKPVDFAKRRRAVSGYLIEERGPKWQARDPGGKFYIRAAYGQDRIIDGDYSIRDRYPGKYETEAEAEAVARELFPNAKRVRY